MKRTKSEMYGDLTIGAALLALLICIAVYLSGCTPAGKARFERVLLTVAEYAVKFGAEAIENEIGSGGEAP